ncbi:HIT family protein [Paenalkalicoccus suaedae]|uniref:HIT family protein n=1 Tax=Paenalkalicoccus suaedae TaxID=2592382 RepID=A0A859FCU5_9BACI|nr:HIT family protein [Paenalkalicoccus suaedae]QKS70750.1 HIT family protein [Paenalkalicoccus suaedae]
MSDCIFCKIVEGEIPSAKVYEDDHVYAFLDLTQVTKGHTLVIPKDHQKNVYELEEQTASELFKAVPKVANALKQAFEPVGMNLLNNNEAPAGQSIFHYHIHLIPRYEGDSFDVEWPDNSGNYTSDDRDNLAKQIQSQLS